nr:DUF2892 domain-containing protein [Oceanipulchritudo coccoides]
MQGKTEKKLSIEQGVMAMAGSFVLVSVILGIIWTPWALGFTLFVGANLLQAAFTGFCPAAMVFAKLGLRGGCVFNK